jgi:hypothetical protein
MPYPPAPTSFDDVIRLVPPRDKIIKHRFTRNERSFEIQIGRNESDFVFIDFCASDEKNEFYPCVRSVGGLMTQRAIWSVWERFLTDPDDHLTWKRFKVKAKS